MGCAGGDTTLKHRWWCQRSQFFITRSTIPWIMAVHHDVVRQVLADVDVALRDVQRDMSWIRLVSLERDVWQRKCCAGRDDVAIQKLVVFFSSVRSATTNKAGTRCQDRHIRGEHELQYIGSTTVCPACPSVPQPRAQRHGTLIDIGGVNQVLSCTI